ncbi:hypothetical protein M378DRAFT_8017 [Amanita muscaria Koide BX008]|uniref:Uncharacterized protein n=1 Tax=Amanita muscaria (strain Koide BX008) TaxID=946122 RepID=A0A0C2T0L8_AMAMK|nr:hypothetical protein M378DRAFT_8017 [Amanita muscaria Koide BX008]
MISTLGFVLFFFIFTYFLSPFFILHVLWLLVAAVRTRRSIAQPLHDIDIVQDHTHLPHPPGMSCLCGDNILKTRSGYLAHFDSDDSPKVAIPDDLPDVFNPPTHEVSVEDALDASLADEVYVVDF